jgi:hypothetical protein
VPALDRLVLDLLRTERTLLHGVSLSEIDDRRRYRE